MRPDWKQYFIEITNMVATRSTCTRRAVGAIIVKENRILTTGYNGPPSGIKHCAERGCLRTQMGIPSGQRHELCIGLHAEQNAILQAAKFGISLDGGELYCTTQPCVTCAKLIINAGIKKVTYVQPYPDEISKMLLDEAGIVVEKYER